MKKLCMLELLGGQTLDQLLPVKREEINRLMRFMLENKGSRGCYRCRRIAYEGNQ
jgi:hypothetical protein